MIKSQDIKEYLGTVQGQELISSVGAVYAVTMAMTCLSLLLAKVLEGKSTVGASVTDAFFIIHFTLSSVCILFLLIQGARGQLTTDKHYRHQRSLVFIIGGTLVLGTGGIIYESLRLALFVTDPDCAMVRDGVHSATCVIFIVLQISFILNYSKIRINKGVYTTCAGKLIMMQVIATNLCTWIRTIVWESEAELNSGNANDGEDANNVTAVGIMAADSLCHDRDELSHIIAPYTFPLLIEFCVAASTLLMYVWEKCGEEHHHESSSHPRPKSLVHHTKSDDNSVSTHNHKVTGTPVALSTNISQQMRNRLYGVADRRLTCIAEHDVESQMMQNGGSVDNYAYDDAKSSTSVAETSESMITSLDNRPIILFTQKNRKLYYNNHSGFILGWMMISMTVVIIILFSYMIYSEHGYTDGLETTIYTTDLILCVVCIIAIVVTARQMSCLTFKDDELRLARKERDGRDMMIIPGGFNVDKNLLQLTFLALLTFQILTIISAVEQDDNVILVASISHLLFGMLQTVFLNWYASNKRVTKSEHFYQKPGRQGLELLRTTNLSLWLVNTFLLENTETKRIHWRSFGHEGWTILSNIFQPLTILYHFHAMVCYADIIAHTYSSKYIGLNRRSHRAIHFAPDTDSIGPHENTADNLSEETSHHQPVTSVTYDNHQPTEASSSHQQTQQL